MDYVLSTQMSFPQLLGLFAIPLVVGLIAYFATRNRSLRTFTLALVGSVVLLLAFTTVSIVDSNVSREAAREKTIKSFQDHYGITLDYRDLRALGYPGGIGFSEPPGKLTYYNTAPIQTGEDRDSFEQLTLAGEDGKIYLYRQVGATYEELEPIGGE